MNRLIVVLLEEAADDWISLVDASGVVGEPVVGEQRSLAADVLRDATFALLDEAMAGGLIEAGDLSEVGFAAWPLTPAEASARIRHAWPAGSAGRDWYDRVWFSITDEGRFLLAREATATTRPDLG